VRSRSGGPHLLHRLLASHKRSSSPPGLGGAAHQQAVPGEQRADGSSGGTGQGDDRVVPGTEQTLEHTGAERGVAAASPTRDRDLSHRRRLVHPDLSVLERYPGRGGTTAALRAVRSRCSLPTPPWRRGHRSCPRRRPTRTGSIREPGSERSLRRGPSPSRHRVMCSRTLPSDGGTGLGGRTRPLTCASAGQWLLMDTGGAPFVRAPPRRGVVGPWTYHPWRRSLCRFRHRLRSWGDQRC
jgi:hypothetical protein